MKTGLRLVLVAALLAGSAPAGAQLRAVRAVPAAGLPAAPVRFAAPALGAAPSLSVVPLSPALPALNDAPKPGEAFRADAARAVAEWKVARAAQPAPAAASAAPARTAEQAAAAATDAIIAAGGVDQALESLVELGVLKVEQLPQGPTDRLALLKRVWDGVSQKRAAELLPVDGSWAVPALRVERGGKTYLVHGVAHGEYYPAHRGSVIRLVKQVKARGGTLLSEQRIPEHYGFAYGLETLDHVVESHDQRAEVVKAARGLPPAAIGAVHALMRYGALGGVAYAWARAALQGADPVAWALAAGGTVLLYLLYRGMQPLNKLSVLAGAREAESLGSPHLAAQLRREAKAFFEKPVKAEDVRALHLPPGPAAATDEFSPRSAAMAAAAEAASGAVVHVLVGYKHAAEVAWRLAGYPAGAQAAEKKEDGRNGGRVSMFSGVAIGAMALGAGLILGGSYVGISLATGAGAALLAAAVLAWAAPRRFSRVPFGSYRAGMSNGYRARIHGWSLSPHTFFQAAVLGALGGPIVSGLMGGSLLWSIAGMALAPIVVDLLKPRVFLEIGGDNGGALSALAASLLAAAAAGVYAWFTGHVARAVERSAAPRSLSLKELYALNVAGMAASVALGVFLGSWVLGLVGLYLVPVPVIFGYVALRRLLGDAVKWPGLRYEPKVTWHGKRDDDASRRNGGRIGAYYALSALLGAVLMALQPVTALVIALTLGALTMGDDLLSARRGKSFPNADKRKKFVGFGLGMAFTGIALVKAGLYGPWVFAAPAVAFLLAGSHFLIERAKARDAGKSNGGSIMGWAIGGLLVGLLFGSIDPKDGWALNGPGAVVGGTAGALILGGVAAGLTLAPAWYAAAAAGVLLLAAYTWLTRPRFGGDVALASGVNAFPDARSARKAFFGASFTRGGWAAQRGREHSYAEDGAMGQEAFLSEAFATASDDTFAMLVLLAEPDGLGGHRVVVVDGSANIRALRFEHGALVLPGGARVDLRSVRRAVGYAYR